MILVLHETQRADFFSETGSLYFTTITLMAFTSYYDTTSMFARRALRDLAVPIPSILPSNVESTIEVTADVESME